ncbi:hypothetical protein EIK76_14615 [Rheinheimera mesophila]|uniref:Uncharacterized protein n=1 Tax=Rheinheimera mesophila TaxID=1547515 RepID=A0A3P3QGN8_9GAMM|nr:hypothetical protein [Rheinheimera mesophila]KKL00615.1 hypothetical protein SD53_13135 [Rheinheimera mesophila]RRJ19669.1 hypothetical protein EIK76_14615 [Rheinheimera mesophila]
MNTTWRTEQLRRLNQTMKAIEILAEHPDLTLIYQGKAWVYRDLLELSVRIFRLAQQEGYDVQAFELWFAKDAELFAHYGLEWRVG